MDGTYPLGLAFSVLKGLSLQFACFGPHNLTNLLGLEDFALECILRTIHHSWPDGDPPPDFLTSSTLTSGHAILRFPGPYELGRRHLAFCLLCYSSGTMVAVEGAYLLVSDVEQEATRILLREAYAVKILDTEDKKSSRRLKQSNLPRTPKSAHSTALTVPDLAFLDDVTSCIRTARPVLTIARELLSEAHPNKTFRGSAHNPAHFLPFPSLTTRDIAVRVGEETFDWLHDLYSAKHDMEAEAQAESNPTWRVDLESPDLDVQLRIVGVLPEWEVRHASSSRSLPRPCPSQPDFPLHLRLLLTFVLPQPLLRAPYLEPGRTSLLRSTAHLLTRIHPFFTPFSESFVSCPKGAVYLDPCAGTGALPYQIQSIMGSPNSPILILAGDNQSRNVNAIASSLDQNPNESTQGLIQPFTWDASGKGASLRTGLVDCIITGPRLPCSLRSILMHLFPLDLPYGHRELSPRALKTLYPSLLANLARVAKVNSYAVLVTAAGPLLRRYLDEDYKSCGPGESCWVQAPIGRKGGMLEREVFIGGIRAWVFLVQNRISEKSQQ